MVNSVSVEHRIIFALNQLCGKLTAWNPKKGKVAFIQNSIFFDIVRVFARGALSIPWDAIFLESNFVCGHLIITLKLFTEKCGLQTFCKLQFCCILSLTQIV